MTHIIGVSANGRECPLKPARILGGKFEMKHIILSAALILVLPLIGISYLFGPTPLQHLVPPIESEEETITERRPNLPWVGWVHDQLQGNHIQYLHRNAPSSDHRNETIEGWRRQLSELQEAPSEWGIIGTMSASYRSRVMYPLYSALPQQDIRQNVLLTFQFFLFLAAVLAFVRMDCKRKGGFSS